MSEMERPIAGRGARALIQRLRRRVRAMPVDRQFGWGAVIVFPPVIFQMAMIYTGHVAWSIVGLALSVTCAIASSWLLRPWFEGLSRKERRRITAVPLIAYIGLGALWVACTLLVAPENRAQAALLLFIVWAYHSLYGSGVEPSSSAYERLRGRLRRAAPLRVAVNWTGLVGALIVLESLRENSNSPTVFLALMGTVALSCLTGSIRVFIRVHRLCAKLDEHAGDLMVELEKLRALPDDKRLEQRFVVEKAWNTLRRTLVNKIDTGLSVSGIFVLPGETINELHHQVFRMVRTGGEDDLARRKVMARLRMIRLSCMRRTDTLV
ncbi:hypothetical protein [Streptomyces sp. SID3915]|uniref:hypothetical protein n=1 Tax=Streptomyces sp. SID3915 TaxID=2690263 RepID=UPI001368DC9F|nr:hypothetical protein [Streptomyces sp. SID3915]MYX77627.1 hypothetical protein [Streptomyces sp. SID3915]